MGTCAPPTNGTLNVPFCHVHLSPKQVPLSLHKAAKVALHVKRRVASRCRMLISEFLLLAAARCWLELARTVQHGAASSDLRGARSRTPSIVSMSSIGHQA
jgi:hypothetical protein